MSTTSDIEKDNGHDPLHSITLDAFEEEDLQISDLDGKGEHKLKLDHHGMPLVPQPTDDPSDPLNWSYFEKMSIITMMSIMSFFSTFALAVMNPACMLFFSCHCCQLTHSTY